MVSADMKIQWKRALEDVSNEFTTIDWRNVVECKMKKSERTAQYWLKQMELAGIINDDGQLVMSLSEGVRRLTSLPAQRLGLGDRGLVREGFKADIVVFDPDAIRSTWTVQEPRSYPTGIEYVIVNGRLTISAGQRTENDGGMVLRAPL